MLLNPWGAQNDQIWHSSQRGEQRVSRRPAMLPWGAGQAIPISGTPNKRKYGMTYSNQILQGDQTR